MSQIKQTVALTLGLILTTTAIALPPKYEATEIPALNSTLGFYTKSINLSGTVVGISYDAFGQNQAELWSGGAAVNLGTLGGEYASAAGINDNGDVVGQSKSKNGAFHAFRYAGGGMTDLGTLGDASLGSYAFGINNKGLVVGAATTPVGNTRAVFWDAGGIHDMGVMKGGTDAYALAVNNGGRICGEGNIDNLGVTHAFIWLNGKFKQIIDKSVPSSARAINNASHVTGVFGTATGYHAFYYDGVKAIDLGTLGGHSSLGWGINLKNDVVGQAANALENDHAFVWTGGKMYDLNDCLTKPLLIPLVNGSAINNKGTITAVDYYGKAYRLKRLP
jgi:probable HAF family extracellular repeat protein